VRAGRGVITLQGLTTGPLAKTAVCILENPMHHKVHDGAEVAREGLWLILGPDFPPYLSHPTPGTSPGMKKNLKLGKKENARNEKASAVLELRAVLDMEKLG
jgi:hypothetical protein